MLLHESFVLFHTCVESANDRVLSHVLLNEPSHLSTSSSLNSSLNQKQSHSADAQKNHLLGNQKHRIAGSFSERIPFGTKEDEAEKELTSLGHIKWSQQEVIEANQKTDKGLHKVTHFLEKENEKKMFGKERREVVKWTEKVKKKEKERRREKAVDKTGKYRFMKSGIGDSWLIGDDSDEYTNAYVNLQSGCEEELIIPHVLTDDSGNTKKVEVIGRYAFFLCGQKVNEITRSVVLSRNIKVIKHAGLGDMRYVTSFRIEEGSCLERIEGAGLSWMSWENTNEDDRNSTLVLPSTLAKIEYNGIYNINPIKTVYYCGSTYLKNESALVHKVSTPDIKVTSSYIYDTIFGYYKPKKDKESIAEAEEKCRNFSYNPIKYFTLEPAEGGLAVSGWADDRDRCPPSIDIPEEMVGETIVAVKESAFYNCDASTAIFLPKSLARVGKNAFANCGANAGTGFALTIPPDVVLEQNAFSNSNVEELFLL